MHRTTSSPPQRTCGVRDMAAPGARNAVCAHSSFSRLAVKSHHVEVAGTGHKSSCTHRSRFAGGLRSLADSRPEKASYYPRQQNTSLFQSVHPRSALVAQCRLRWFVNPACRGAEQIVSWGASSMLSVLPESSYPVSSISNERTMFDLPDLHAGHVRQFFFFLIRWVRLLAVLVKP